VALPLSYVVRRVGQFVLVVWITATINFVVVRLAPGDPTAGMLSRMAQQGDMVQGGAALVSQYRATFGLNDPAPLQYLKYLWALCHLDLGYSISNFPTGVAEIIASAAPWTIGLLVTSTLISFAVGSLLGALMVWQAAPALARMILPAFMVLAAIPYYLLALLLLYVLAFTLHVFPVTGVSSIGDTGSLTLGSALDVLDHSVLPALSIVLSAVGFWMLGMRGMMVTVIGSDYLTLAEAKGLKERRVFIRYAMRNAILPQITSLAIALGYVASGAILVEVIFSYPGIGSALYTAITNNDYPLIEGITLMLVIAVAVAILILDLLYPRIDPRITYQRR